MKTVNETVFLLLREALFGCQDGIMVEDGCAQNNTLENSGKTPEKPTKERRKDRSEQEDEKTLFWEQVYNEIQNQAVLGITAPIISGFSEIPENLRVEWSSMQKPYAIRYVQMATEQDRACRLLQNAGIGVAVMKGMAAAIYYPSPELRSMGDVDLLVRPEDYKAAIELLLNNGYVLTEEAGKYHAAFHKYKVVFELHQSPAGTHISEKGETVAQYILSGLNLVETNSIGQDTFPILPWKQNGMELIWHIRQHLYNGLGLRQIIDWMMFVNYLLDDTRMSEYLPDLRRCGLDQLAISVTKMCQKYLGLRHEGITWCDGADERLCDELMEFIMGQGNFGMKAMDEKTAKVLSGYDNPRAMLKKLQEFGEAEWKILESHPVLRPFAFLYGGASAIRIVFGKAGGWRQIIKDIRLGQQRKQMFSKLYGIDGGSGLSATKPCKDRVRNLIGAVNQTRFAEFFRVVTDFIAFLEYYIYELVCICSGYRMPTKDERELVRTNVTFIYKSFERQKMAKQLYRNIQRFYPGTRVIIADDSRKPLNVKGKYAEVINLPFNSGLSHGLNKALECVRTPYVIRLDDDHLLTRRTHVGEQLDFLKKHTEVNLVGFGILNAVRLETPKQHIKKFYPQSMSYAPKSLIIPHMTRIDGNHLVLGKGLNLFLIKTNDLERIGYDERIRMMEHDDFFYRAAGNIVSVVAEDTRVFHRHNLFDRNYLVFRNDIEGDARYIWNRRWESK